MIDIHAHILPGLDDGPADLAGAIAIAKAAVDGGTRIMAATPHTLNGVYLNRRSDVIVAVERLQSELDVAGIPLRLLPGSDVALVPELIEAFDAGEVTSIADGKKYLLVELPLFYRPSEIHNVIFQLATRGITPIISHPERDPHIKENPGWLADFVERGCLSQITASSIVGGFGKKVRAFAKTLMEYRLVHIIASDCHSSNVRGPDMGDAVREAARIVGEEAAARMVDETPAAIIEGRPVEVPPVLKINRKKRGWFWSLS